MSVTSSADQGTAFGRPRANPEHYSIPLKQKGPLFSCLMLQFAINTT
jgi:hypothetical protein